ncbi:glycosyl transferase family 2 [Brasilonema octagenarum UFV-E1]|uniref:Glycosyl transferase family 2 n=2 Tax=Brasilonema TaxID=383614 RepID=A0A856MCR0_9CYAN|nr:MULTISPECIES: glycosyltransferase [Brasilonema]NMF61295.1 glycosyl transferase family 2 [Brasilonema octagenarum UFV-OR1]QDL09075.1 glycosyl transferase family 2 [Brasilonema sennae CENA114]QDL15433.1 glycosyl transferase family 2 [Brasilonema octagenarum UFV-E1]
MSGEIGLWLSVLSLVIWVILLGFWGQFWRCDQRLTRQETNLQKFPAICAVVPARNEAELLPVSLRSLLTQNYPGSFTVVLVDDNSTDGTANIASSVAQELNRTQQLHVLSGQPLPAEWTGKLWALHQGIEYVETLTLPPDYILLTDADIEHDAQNLRSLVTKAQQENLELVSLMVLLRCESFWEKVLIPAFVFFFQKLYPFPWVNDSTKPTAAAAGGCILIASQALTRIGGIQVVRNALIDDCALGQAVKSSRFTKLPHEAIEKAPEAEENIPSLTPSLLPSLSSSHKIWLGLDDLTHSLRSYPSLSTVWDMVARTAFTQLHYSLGLLILAVIGMILVYIVPPVSAIFGLLTGTWLVACVGLLSWLLMSCAYLPTIRFYRCSPWFALCLPGIALLYTLMTIDSAVRHWQKRGGTWKGRVYSKT